MFTEKRLLRLFPRGITSAPMGNEHVIYGYGDLVEETQFKDLKIEIVQKLLEVFPGGSNRGNRFEVYHQPTEEEIAHLQQLANELESELEIRIRTDSEYKAEQSAEASRRSRR